MASTSAKPQVNSSIEKKRQLLGQPKARSLKKIEDAFHDRTSGRYLPDLVFGANDGIITTFAVVAGATGANLSAAVVTIIGLANLLGDGLSMCLGNYLGLKSERDYQREQRQKELWEIQHIPEVEIDELKEIFKKWGFAGADLDRAASIISQNPSAWADIMMTHELGILEEADRYPARHGLATFIAFAVAGFVPILPYVAGLDGPTAFWSSLSLTALALFTIGALRSKITAVRFLRAGIEMLLVGGLAAGAAYLIGEIIGGLVKGS